VKRADKRCDQHYSDLPGGKSEDAAFWEGSVGSAQACAFSIISSGNKVVHLNRRLPSVSEYNHYLVPLRNLVDRLISWFYYETGYLKQPKEELVRRSRLVTKLMQCYQDANSLMTDGLAPIQRNTTNGRQSQRRAQKNTEEECRELARGCLTGEVPCYAHNFYNYEWYLERLLLWKGDYVDHPSDRIRKPQRNRKGGDDFRIDVVRVEHDVQDLNRTLHLWTHGLTTNDHDSLVNLYLQKRPNHLMLDKIQATADKTQATAYDKFVGSQGLQNLCRRICPELVVYKKILYHADNLFDHEVQQSYDELDERCGLNVDKVCGVDFYYRDYYNYKRHRICDPKMVSERGRRRLFKLAGRYQAC
jgi:hypothetical protein